MSLARLLTSGKSLVTFRNSAGHYRMRPKNLLPKFGAEKNPFSSSVPRAGDVASNADATSSTSCVEKKTAVVGEQNKPLAAVSADQSKKPTKPAQKRLLIDVGTWFRKLRPAAWWRKSRTPQPLIPKFARTAVQGELSLDNVKVVRNDLSDTDVEIVRRPTSGKMPVTRAERADATGELVKT